MDLEFPADWEDEGGLGEAGVYDTQDCENFSVQEEADAEDKNDEIQYEDYEDFEDEEPVDDGIKYEDEDYDEPEPTEPEGWDQDQEVHQDQDPEDRESDEEFEEVAEEMEDVAEEGDQIEEVADMAEQDYESKNQKEWENDKNEGTSRQKRRNRKKVNGKTARGGRKLREKKWRLWQAERDKQKEERNQQNQQHKWRKKWKDDYGKDYKDYKDYKGYKDYKDYKEPYRSKRRDEWSEESDWKRWDNWEEKTPEVSEPKSSEPDTQTSQGSLKVDQELPQTGGTNSPRNLQKGPRLGATDTSKVIHPWHAQEVPPPERTERLWPAGLASSLPAVAKGSKSKGRFLSPQPLFAGKGVQPAQPPGPITPMPVRVLQGKGGTLRADRPPTQVAPPTQGKGGTLRADRRPVQVAPPTQDRRPMQVAPPTQGKGGTVRAGQPMQVAPRFQGKGGTVRAGKGSSVPAGHVHLAGSPKRPREETAASSPEGAKRFKAEPSHPVPAPAPAAQESTPVPQQTKTAMLKISMLPSVADKIGQLKAIGVKLTTPALREVAAANAKDACVLLQALMSKCKYRPEEVPNPSEFVIGSLTKRASQAKEEAAASPPAQQSRPPVEHRPAAGAAPARAPAKAPAKVLPRPPAKAPPAPAPKTQPVARVPGQGQQPRLRKDLPFERQTVQEKLIALNKQGIWAKQGKAYPLDESALSALMQIEPARGLEILDEAERQGMALADPSRYARELAAEEEKVFPQR